MSTCFPIKNVLVTQMLEKEMATHSGIFAWRIPWTEEPGGLQSMGSQRVGHDWTTNTHRKESDTTERLHFHTLKFLQRRLAFEEKMSKSNQDTSCIVEQSYGFAGLVQQPAHAITRASFCLLSCSAIFIMWLLASWPHHGCCTSRHHIQRRRILQL